ncbi:MAG: TIGR04283 family arsenosugar biosynthesis glycosyltransferase [Gammaproteobacteria bacterium]|nr:TIGR04283 family arsenosugar biosynthesis glycosyltransferase [Gammaproteobacteria bacterium]
MQQAPVTAAQLSIIIPCRNEASKLPRLLQQLATQEDIKLEIIVADGESEDDSILVAKATGAKVSTSAANRGAQMNQGAALASSDWLLFLHADSALTHTKQLQRALAHIKNQQGDLVAGHFPLTFIDRPQHQRRWRVLEFKTTTNLPLTISGDQGLLIQKSNFEQLGGFETHLPFLEDQTFAAKLHTLGRWVLLPDQLETSARRFTRQGFTQRYLLMTLIMVAYCCRLPAFLNPKALYPEQGKAQPISLAEHIRRFNQLSFQQHWFAVISLYWRIAGLARENLYQAPLWLDSVLHLKSWPLTRGWLASGQKLAHLPLCKQILQLLLLPAFPLFTHLWLLNAAIAARIKKSPTS